MTLNCACMWVCACVRVCVRASVRVRTYARMNVCMYMCIRTCTNPRTRTNARTHARTPPNTKSYNSERTLNPNQVLLLKPCLCGSLQPTTALSTARARTRTSHEEISISPTTSRASTCNATNGAAATRCLAIPVRFGIRS